MKASSTSLWRGGAEGLWGGITKGKKPLGLMDLFIILFTVLVSGIYTDVKTYQIVHFKHVQYAVCQSYFSKAVFKKASIKADIYHVCGLASSTVSPT